MDDLSRRLLEQQFHDAMLDIYTVAGKSTGYWAGYFLRTVRKYGGLETARDLLGQKGTSSGFERLKEEGRLDLSMEALVLRAEFRPLFTPAELAKARQRLAEYGFGGPEIVGTSLAELDPEAARLLAQIDAANPSDRMDYRNTVVALGPPAREAMRRWLAEEHLSGFAISVLEKLAATDQSAARAIENYATHGGRDQKLATAALDRLHRPAPRTSRGLPAGASTYRSTGVPEAPTGGGCEVIVQERPCSNPARHPVAGLLMCTIHRQAWERSHP